VKDRERERAKEIQVVKNHGGGRVNNNSLFSLHRASAGTNVLFSLSPLFFRTINYLRDQWRK